MCSECRQYPCHPSCPSSPPSCPVLECDLCGEGIFEGEEYYGIGGDTYCETCVNTRKFIAEAKDYEQ